MNGLALGVVNLLLDSGDEIARLSEEMNADIATEQIVALILLACMLAIATWLFFVWAIRDKQFDEVEEISKRVLELDAEPNHAEVLS